MTHIAREAGVARTTVTGYLDILEETLLCFRLPAYEAKLRARERKLPKWYWCDPGLVRVMKRASGAPVPEERGPLFEGLVGQLLRAYRDYRGLFDHMAYWAPADRSTIEVDFILVRGTDLIAIEVKSGSTFREDWCKGLRAVKSLQGLQRRIIVYPRGPVLRTHDDIDVLPFQTFSDCIAKDNLWY